MICFASSFRFQKPTFDTFGSEILLDVRVPSLNRTFAGKVARFSVDVREDTRTMHTEVDVQNPDGCSCPGCTRRPICTRTQRRHPDGSGAGVESQGDKTACFVVDPNGTWENRNVRLGLQTANDAEILSGLNEGEQVVVSDRSGLKPGEKVHPQTVAVSSTRKA